MPEKTKKDIVYYLDFTNLALLTILFLFLPLIFLTSTTDAFILPKQILLAIAVSLSCLILGVKTIFEGKIKFRSTPFDLPIALLTLAVLASSIFAVNKYDSFIAFLPFLFATLLYFVIINTIKSESKLLIVLSALVLGTTISALVASLSFFNIYILPQSYSHVNYFNTFGSLLDQAIYFALILPVTGYFVWSVFVALTSQKKTPSVFATDKKSSSIKTNPLSIGFTIAFAIILIALITTTIQLVSTQKPLILPLDTGIQTTFAPISQDTGRVFFGFLFGSGFGTFATDFTRFKPVSFNQDSNLWSFTFFRSSTFILELFATTGILGLASFLFLIFKILKERSFFLPLILAIIIAILLPFSFTITILFFALLGIFAVIHAHNNPHKFTDVELYFVALKRGLLAARSEGESVSQNTTQRKYSKLLPSVFFIILMVLIGFPVYFTAKYFVSDINYQRSLIAYSQNKNADGYNLQLSSINIFPYRDLYYRGLSQTDMALANGLASQLHGASPSAQAQQNILLLIQQSITAGRNATMLAPQSASNWSNLSAVYRNLIGFGQNADQFAILTSQQAIALDPRNPQEYIDLGGIYYQLGDYDNAIRQFQTAISLKNDYANSYYNLGHALALKGNLQEALNSLTVVKTLVTNDQTNYKKILGEIGFLQEKITKQNQQPAASLPSTPANTSASASGANEPLTINQPGNKLPEVKTKIKIPGLTITPGAGAPSTSPSNPVPSETINTTPTP